MASVQNNGQALAETYLRFHMLNRTKMQHTDRNLNAILQTRSNTESTQMFLILQPSPQLFHLSVSSSTRSLSISGDLRGLEPIQANPDLDLKKTLICRNCNQPHANLS